MAVLIADKKTYLIIHWYLCFKRYHLSTVLVQLWNVDFNAEIFFAIFTAAEFQWKPPGIKDWITLSGYKSIKLRYQTINPLSKCFLWNISKIYQIIPYIGLTNYSNHSNHGNHSLHGYLMPNLVNLTYPVPFCC